MSDISKPPKSEGCWAPYEPDDKAPWNLRRVVHLHRRAGFAATWSEIERDLKDGPKASIDRILAGKACSEGVPDQFAEKADLLGSTAASSRDAARLKAWWVFRMLFGPDPLTERLVLMWHNHLATSNLKVEDLPAMHQQNQHFREHARAPFGKLLNVAVRDSAMLMWLDAPANRRGHPNENLGRELVELFTLGIGHYTEKDVKEAARALTGWTVDEDGKFAELPIRHDDGEKTILGKKGKWKGDDLVKTLLDHPATAQRLSFRVCELFMDEGTVDAAMTKALADGLRQRNLDIGWAVETVLRSQAFFADANLGKRVLSPVEYVIGAARALELFDPPSSTLVLAEWTGRLGQDLFYPPNVGGWPGGRTWLTTRSVIGRANYAADLVEGDRVGRPGAPLGAVALAQRHGHAKDRDTIIAFYTKLLLGTELTAGWRDRLTAALGSGNDAKPETIRKAVALILAMPEAQLG
ncbi:MAG TPA: DUF1800 domain-containing protein [Gemmataceae bacterium]|nr:DUF1800 domain-containing protein [Gemmataceae bacterium]